MEPLLAVTLRSLMIRRNWNNYRSILSDESFPNTNASAVYQLLLDLHAVNKRNVTEKTLRIAADATLSADRATEIGGVIDSIMGVTKGEIDDAEYAIRKYVARGLSFKAARMVVTHGDSPAFDYGIPAALMSRAANVAQNKLQERQEACQAGLPGDAEMVRKCIPLGIHPDLDKELMGGVGRGELLIVLAPPERGKTSYLWRMATNAVLGKENVVAYTLEIARYKCFLRYYQGLTGLTNSEMARQPQLVAARRAQARKKGTLWVNDFSSIKFTPSMLEADLEQMFDEGLDPTYVMIDYMEMMFPTGGFGYKGKSSASLGEMVQEIRQIGVQFNVPIVSAWQINRPGAEKIVYSSTDISESWEVIKVADIILGLNQGPIELNNMVMRLKTMKQREDTSRGLHYLHSDLRRLIIHPLEGANNEQTRQAD